MCEPSATATPGALPLVLINEHGEFGGAQARGGCGCPWAADGASGLQAAFTWIAEHLWEAETSAALIGGEVIRCADRLANVLVAGALPGAADEMAGPGCVGTGGAGAT